MKKTLGIKKHYSVINSAKYFVLAIVFICASFASFISSPIVSATAPQDTYAWQKNIGTYGCPSSMFAADVAAHNGKLYVSDTNHYAVDIFDVDGTFLKSFGSKGSGDGQFNYGPGGVAFDASGDMYVADNAGKRIQKFDANGNYLSQFSTKVSGTGSAIMPSGIDIDSNGNVYVTGNGSTYSDFYLQKYSASGTYISQVGGAAGSGNGQFAWPNGIATDSSNNVYVVDAGNNRVQKFSSTGVYISQFGSKGEGDGQFKSPTGIMLDLSGNIYVADNQNGRIKKFSSSGVYISQFGASGYGHGQFNFLSSISLDTSSGDIYAADNGGGSERIERFDSAGNFISQFTYVSNPTDATKLCEPAATAIGPDGNLYVVDSTYWYGNGWGNIKVYNPKTGALLRVIGAQASSSDGQLTSPISIVISQSGTIYVSNYYGNRITMFNLAGDYLGAFGSTGSADGQFNGPEGIALDSSNNVYVVDANNYRVQKFTSSGTYISQFGSKGSNDDQFNGPEGIAVDALGNIYVSDSRSSKSKIVKFSPDGTYISQFGSYGSSNGQFERAVDLAIDAAGDLLVPDSWTNQIVKFSTDGTYLGSFGSSGSSDGQFDSPLSITQDGSGNVYIADDVNGRISVWNAPILPSAPRYVVVKPMNATSLKLSWAAPAHIGSSPLTAYRVMFRVAGTSNWTTAAKLSPSTFSYTLMNLMSATKYDVQVVAVNAIGASADSPQMAGAIISVTMPSSDKLADTGSNIFFVTSSAGLLIIVGLLAIAAHSRSRRWKA